MNFLESEKNAKEFLKEVVNSNVTYEASIDLQMMSQGDTYDSKYYTLEDDSLRNLIPKIESITKNKFSDFVFSNVRGKDNELVTSSTRNYKGNIPNDRETDLWKQGEETFYTYFYVINIFKIGKVPLDRQELKKVGIKY